MKKNLHQLQKSLLLLWRGKSKILASFIFLAFMQSSATAQTAIVFVNPATQNQVLGSSFTVKVSVDVTSGCHNAVEIHLEFDKTILQVTSKTRPSFNPDYVAGDDAGTFEPARPFTAESITLPGSNTSINNNGRIDYAVGIPAGHVICADYDILEITFTSIAAGTSYLRFPNSDPFTRPASNGNPVLPPVGFTSPVDGQAVITSGAGCNLTNATLSSTATCDGQPFNLTFQSVTYSSGSPSPPYDLVVNGTTYTDITPGTVLATGITTATQSLWPVSSGIVPDPLTDALNDGEGGIEVGTRFSASVNGYIKGIRLYNGFTNPTGTYTGKLYANDGGVIVNTTNSDDRGVPLATANFAPFTGEGWKEVLFSTPVEITANTVYVATYFSSAGNYAKTNNYFQSSSHANNSLTAPMTDGNPEPGGGANGVFTFENNITPDAPAAPGFPQRTFNGGSYFVDVLFVPKDTTFTFSVIDAASCTVTGTPLTVTSVDCSTLPVSLLNLSATPQGNKVTLKWATASEENNRGFDIQRSNDGLNWTTIGFVAGAGNSSFTKNYSYLDANLAARRYYYRLKQIDIDARFKYSAIVSATLTGKGEYLLGQNYPNPTNNETTVQFTLPKAEKVNLSLFDVSGRIVKVLVNGSKDAGTHAINFNVGSLTRGIYYYRIQAGDFTDVKKLTIQ